MGQFVDEILDLEPLEAGRDPARYQQWIRENTRVISGPIGNTLFRGVAFESRTSALSFWENHATVVEDASIEGRWIFRIKNRLKKPLPQEYNAMRTNWDAKKFVTLWQTASSPDEVARGMRLTRTQVIGFAARLRKAGVNLKSLRVEQVRFGEEIDVAELNALVAK